MPGTPAPSHVCYECGQGFWNSETFAVHACDPQRLADHQAAKAEQEMRDDNLAAHVARWGSGESARHHRDFAEFLRQREEGKT